jgi:hypothetical protein
MDMLWLDPVSLVIESWPIHWIYTRRPFGNPYAFDCAGSYFSPVAALAADDQR